MSPAREPRNQVEVDHDLYVPFKWKDDTPGGRNLGRAEFVVCVKPRRGEVSEFWVSPEQQRDMDTFWHRGSSYNGMFHIASYQGLSQAKVWLGAWCREHKCLGWRIYAPDGAKLLRIDGYGVSFWKSKP